MKYSRGTGVLLLACLASIGNINCVERTYFFGIREENWDYAPSGRNRINDKPVSQDEHASVFLERGPTRIGSVYKKAVYVEYSDASYSKRLPKAPWLGFLGPTLKAEVGDVLVVHLRNFASRRHYSMHPHGVFYEKDAEGALYPDGTSGRAKLDDAVPPGGTHTYRWLVTPDYAPTDGDANCLTWVYHSHIDAPKDIYSGLIGAILTCRTGTLQQVSGPNGTELRRADVDHDFLLMFSVVDENLSWYLEDNIKTFCSDLDGIDRDDEDFRESNLMHGINGFLYGNLPGLELCLNGTVAWHLFGMGNEVDMHSVYFHGHTLLERRHRTDVLSLFPASFVTADMLATTAGRWLINCQVNDHLQAGMQALFQVRECGKDSSSSFGRPVEARVRQYFIAAENVLWDYAPSGMDIPDNVLLTEEGRDSVEYFGKGEGRLGGIYEKVMYVSYTDATFSQKTARTEADKHLGILGPIMAAEVGDVLEVTFLNRAVRNFSIQPHGLQYEKASEGAQYQDGETQHRYTPGSAVAPGERYTYSWQVREGPSPDDPPCVSYLYFSASDPVKDTNSGLVGPLKVCRRGFLDANAAQSQRMSRDFFLLFTVMNENESWYIDDNTRRYGTAQSEPDNEDFQESNKMHSVNGLMYGNLQGLDMCQGERVTWHLFGLGTEGDMHGVHFQGNTFQMMGTTSDAVSVFPHTAATVAMQTDNTGELEVSCRVTDHYVGGMRHLYHVRWCSQEDGSVMPPPPRPTAPRPTVTYFIRAEEVVWDYAPDRTWELQKHNTTAEESPGDVFVGRGEDRIGSKYKKVVYRAYTDATFRTAKRRTPEEEHLGILGPIIRAEVGERILVTFNNAATRQYNMYAHGVGTIRHTPVPKGETRQIQWDVLEAAGPGPSDPDCISYAYYSSVNFVKDTMSGLIGPLVICRKGALTADRRLQRGVSRDFALLFMVFDENQSWYLEENVRQYLGKETAPVEDEDFQESNMMHGINGLLYGNLQGIRMVSGETVQWHLMGMGNEVDIHTVHFHAETFIYKLATSHRADVFDLFPGTFKTIEMVAQNPGTWLLHCHVADHIHAGMETTFTITDRSGGTGNGAPSLIAKPWHLLITLGICYTMGICRLH
ncbi:ferroxidase HEPHL1-like [Engraulis encrasicolus]|uniref:ferroxidase HEPHL1-like n=1 Tax=Engraulis encrasicolus TaxID=184585 RepID=UPI002FCFA607